MAGEDDIYALLMGSPGDSQAVAKALAQRLRDSRGMAQLASLGGKDPILSGLGGTYQKQASEDEKNLFGAIEKRAQATSS